ncbi:S24 family peptidase [Psychrobacter sp. I-STPA10]|uniref:S24 family peptidase n=1 Tax=Psychrobacter sp. I-STPA10 TaxID=2585769 RepID=UPI001E30CFB3|nr:S24 family peptidase [Psychrobacter sp. I-STPA10]
MSDNHPTMQRIFDQTGKSPSEVASDLNTSPQNITNWSKRGISKAGAIEASKKYNLSLDWLLTGKGKPTEEKPSIADLQAKINQIQSDNGQADNNIPSDTNRVAMTNLGEVPIISWVAAGSWSNVEPVTMEDALGFAPRPAHLSKNGFALRVRGRSMLPEFKPEEIIYVEPEAGLFTLKDGDLIVIQGNDDTEATFKQLVIGDTSDDMYLKPLNPDWPEQKMIPMSECRLVGKVIGKYVVY